MNIPIEIYLYSAEDVFQYKRSAIVSAFDKAQIFNILFETLKLYPNDIIGITEEKLSLLCDRLFDDRLGDHPDMLTVTNIRTERGDPYFIEFSISYKGSSATLGKIKCIVQLADMLELQLKQLSTDFNTTLTLH